MEQAGWLFASGGVLSFLGFILVAAGVAQGIPVGYAFGTGVALLSPMIPWGIVLIGLGLMLALFGAAIKGPSAEWSEIAADSRGETPLPPLAPGVHFACPGCGGDVYSSQEACPTCGRRLPQI